jgi:hypothetical protein
MSDWFDGRERRGGERRVSAFRLALIGAGRMGSTHARALREYPSVELAGVRTF